MAYSDLAGSVEEANDTANDTAEAVQPTQQTQVGPSQSPKNNWQEAARAKSTLIKPEELAKLREQEKPTQSSTLEVAKDAGKMILGAVATPLTLARAGIGGIAAGAKDLFNGKSIGDAANTATKVINSDLHKSNDPLEPTTDTGKAVKQYVSETVGGAIEAVKEGLGLKGEHIAEKWKQAGYSENVSNAAGALAEGAVDTLLIAGGPKAAKVAKPVLTATAKVAKPVLTATAKVAKEVVAATEEKLQNPNHIVQVMDDYVKKNPEHAAGKSKDPELPTIGDWAAQIKKNGKTGPYIRETGERAGQALHEEGSKQLLDILSNQYAASQESVLRAAVKGAVSPAIKIHQFVYDAVKEKMTENGGEYNRFLSTMLTAGILSGAHISTSGATTAVGATVGAGLNVGKKLNHDLQIGMAKKRMKSEPTPKADPSIESGDTPTPGGPGVGPNSGPKGPPPAASAPKPKPLTMADAVANNDIDPRFKTGIPTDAEFKAALAKEKANTERAQAQEAIDKYRAEKEVARENGGTHPKGDAYLNKLKLKAAEAGAKHGAKEVKAETGGERYQRDQLAKSAGKRNLTFDLKTSNKLPTNPAPSANPKKAQDRPLSKSEEQANIEAQKKKQEGKATRQSRIYDDARAESQKTPIQKAQEEVDFRQSNYDYDKTPAKAAALAQARKELQVQVDTKIGDRKPVDTPANRMKQADAEKIQAERFNKWSKMKDQQENKQARTDRKAQNHIDNYVDIGPELRAKIKDRTDSGRLFDILRDLTKEERAAYKESMVVREAAYPGTTEKIMDSHKHSQDVRDFLKQEKETDAYIEDLRKKRSEKERVYGSEFNPVGPPKPQPKKAITATDKALVSKVEKIKDEYLKPVMENRRLTQELKDLYGKNGKPLPGKEEAVKENKATQKKNDEKTSELLKKNGLSRLDIDRWWSLNSDRPWADPRGAKASEAVPGFAEELWASLQAKKFNALSKKEIEDRIKAKYNVRD